MKISTQEHHGYFTLEMGYYEGMGIDSCALCNLRFALVLLSGDHKEFVLNGKKYSFDRQILLCVNEHEILQVSEDIQVMAILFHPSVVNGAFDFVNIRTKTEEFDVTQMQDNYYLMAFTGRKEKQNGILHPTQDSYERIHFLMGCFHEQITQQDTNFWACRSRSFLIEMLSICSTLAEEKEILLHNSEDIAKQEMQSMIVYLQNNLYKKITISDLTKEFQINRTDLSREFLAYTGETVMEYLNRIRIDFAAAMLRDTKIPLVDIMERVGFRDYSYFSHTFKKKKGISTQAYRKKYCWM